jgi:hypothetical protein
MLRKRNALVEMKSTEFKQNGFQLIDSIADFIDTMCRKPVTTKMSSAQFSEIIVHQSLPENGKEATEIVNRATNLLFNYSLLNGHPKFLGLEAFLLNAVIGDKYCLRACIVNFKTPEKDIEDIVETIVRSGRKVAEFIKNKSV